MHTAIVVANVIGCTEGAGIFQVLLMFLLNFVSMVKEYTGVRDADVSGTIEG